MSREIKRQNIQRLEQYFHNGCKKDCRQKLGVELEHFIVEPKRQKNVPYSGTGGVRELLEEWQAFYPGVYREDGVLLGLYNSEYGLSLEPAAQLEISIAPQEKISSIERVYRSFLRTVLPSLERRGYALVTAGCRPFGTSEELELIPKKRYRYMDAYFQEKGPAGRQMMRSTAATQVSIDYCSEQDFTRKYRTACLAMPALKLLTDNTRILEDKPYSGYLARTGIWSRVDEGRCGILPGVFDSSFGFRAYAEYLWKLEPIVVPEKGNVRPVGHQRVCGLWADRLLEEEEIAHILSMTFPDVRAKQYVEIRGADSMPLPYVLAYTALLKGLTFDKTAGEELLDRYPVDSAAVKKAERSLAEKGFEGEIYGEPAAGFCRRLIDLAAKQLEPEERRCLELFEELVQMKKTMGRE